MAARPAGLWAQGPDALHGDGLRGFALAPCAVSRPAVAACPAFEPHHSNHFLEWCGIESPPLCCRHRARIARNNARPVPWQRQPGSSPGCVVSSVSSDVIQQTHHPLPGSSQESTPLASRHARKAEQARPVPVLCNKNFPHVPPPRTPAPARSPRLCLRRRRAGLLSPAARRLHDLRRPRHPMCRACGAPGG